MYRLEVPERTRIDGFGASKSRVFPRLSVDSIGAIVKQPPIVGGERPVVGRHIIETFVALCRRYVN